MIFSRVGKQLKRPKEYTTLEHLSSQSHDSSPPNGQSQDIVEVNIAGVEVDVLTQSGT